MFRFVGAYIIFSAATSPGGLSCGSELPQISFPCQFAKVAKILQGFSRFVGPVFALFAALREKITHIAAWARFTPVLPATDKIQNKSIIGSSQHHNGLPFLV